MSKMFYFLYNSPIFIKYWEICKNNYDIIMHIAQNRHSEFVLLDYDLIIRSPDIDTNL